MKNEGWFKGYKFLFNFIVKFYHLNPNVLRTFLRCPFETYPWHLKNVLNLVFTSIGIFYFQVQLTRSKNK